VSYSTGSFGFFGTQDITANQLVLFGKFVSSVEVDHNFIDGAITGGGGFSVCMLATPSARSATGQALAATRISVSVGHNQGGASAGFDGDSSGDFYFRLSAGGTGFFSGQPGFTFNPTLPSVSSTGLL
jgi:hypothetical protein